jgi:sugar (pentulose or hexulose) kinase
MAVAATAVLVIGGGSASLLWRDTPATVLPTDDQVSAWDFEAGAVAGAVDSSESSDDQEVFVGGFESGDFSGWKTFS